jgi:hypothetical protein
METVESLCARYDVDLDHAHHVSALALGLFDALASEHGLAARDRELLETAAVLHNVALAQDPARHHTLGRDIIMAAPLSGFDPAERGILACMVAFHRKTVVPEDEPIFVSLRPAHGARVLALSALLRIADGLDYSQTHTTCIDKIELGLDYVDVDVDVIEAELAPAPPHVPIRVQTSGPHSHSDAARANKKADLWNALFAPLMVRGRMTQPGLAPEVTLAEAGRLILRCELDRLAPDEWILAPGARMGPLRIARLRQAASGLSAVLPAFEGYYKKKGIRPVLKGLRALAARLEAEHAADTLARAAKAALPANGSGDAPGLQALLADWRAQRRSARDALAEYLAGDRHAGWLDDAQALAADSARDRPPELGQPSLARHAARLIHRQYLSAVQSYDTLPDPPAADDLAALRQSVEALRAITEALREVLPVREAEQTAAACAGALGAYGPAIDARAASAAALRYLAEAAVDGAPMGDIIAFAEGQQRTVDEQLRGWRQFLEPFLVL